jgi:hypothetical protein
VSVGDQGVHSDPPGISMPREVHREARGLATEAPWTNQNVLEGDQGNPHWVGRRR